MTIATELARLRTAPLAELVALHVQLTGDEPKSKHHGHLFRRVAWLVQAREYGGLDDAALAHLDEQIAQLDVDLSSPPQRPTQRVTERNGLAVGSTIKRRYTGTDIVVHVRENGFEWRGEMYSSLTAIARKATGARWSGPLFFGLTKRSRDR